jgi:hypothetical protein
MRSRRQLPPTFFFRTQFSSKLYQAFPAAEARRVLRRQCLERRIATREKLVSEIAAWQRQRNASCARIKWMFKTKKDGAKNGPRLSRAGHRSQIPRQRLIITVQQY